MKACCQNCGTTLNREEKRCCNQFDCECQGKSEPDFCNQECYDKYISDLGG